MFQVVVEGVYHADPHHGNVLLTEDGRLALLARRSGATFGFPPRLRSWARRSHRADSIARILDPELDPVSLIEQESLEVMTREVEHRLEPNRSLSCVDDPPLRPCLRVTRLGARHRDASRPAMSWASDRSDLPFGVAPSSLEAMAPCLAPRRVRRDTSLLLVRAHADWLGIAGFCLAAVLGLYMIWKIIRTPGEL